MSVQVVSSSSRPDLDDEAQAAFRERWPEFIFHDPIPRTYMSRVQDYASWKGPDGLSIDPWIRTHQRMGARIIGPAPDSMVIPGTVAEWEQWADMPLPVTGHYVVPDALNMLDVSREDDLAVYREETLWDQHR